MDWETDIWKIPLQCKYSLSWFLTILVISYLSLCMTNYPQTSWLRTIPIYDLRVSEGQESRHCLARCFYLKVLSQGCNWSVSQSCGLIWRLDWGIEGLTSKLIHMLVGRIKLLVDFESLHYLLAVGWRPPSIHFHVDLSTGHLATWELASLEWVKERTRSEQGTITVFS